MTENKKPIEAKLTIEHLAPYLPYKLHVKLEFASDTELPWYYEDKETFNLEGMMIDWYDGSNITKITPMLRPLSDLTKEIQHNGHTFTPISELLKISQTDCKYGLTSKYDVVKIWSEPCLEGLGYFIRYSWEASNDMVVLSDLAYDTMFNRFTLRQKSPLEKCQWLQYDILENKLLEWHFDKFGLIDAGLAIDINTLNP